MRADEFITGPHTSRASVSQRLEAAARLQSVAILTHAVLYQCTTVGLQAVYIQYVSGVARNSQWRGLELRRCRSLPILPSLTPFPLSLFPSLC